MQTPTEDFAKRLQAGDVTVARELYREYGRLVFAVAHRVLGNPTMAEDTVQQTFLQAWTRTTVDPERDLRPWLCTIAQRAAIDLQRRESRRSHEAIDPDRPQPELVIEPDLDAVSDVWRVREAVAALPDEEQAIVRLQHFEGYTMTEIGERLGIPVGTVKSRSHRAHRHLVSALRAHGGGRLMDEFPPIEATDEEAALLNELLADESMWAEPSPGLEDRVVATIENAAGAEPAEAGTDDDVQDITVVDLGAAREKKRSRVAQIAPWIIAVAAVFAAVVFATQPFDSGSSRDFTVALAATPLAPGAHADGDLTNTSSGVDIKLDVTGLPRAPTGSFYQAWVKGANGLVPVGTFHTGGQVTLWSGVDVKQYPDMTVTIEPEDGNPASSGHRVLAGPIVPS